MQCFLKIRRKKDKKVNEAKVFLTKTFDTPLTFSDPLGRNWKLFKIWSTDTSKKVHFMKLLLITEKNIKLSLEIIFYSTLFYFILYASNSKVLSSLPNRKGCFLHFLCPRVKMRLLLFAFSHYSTDISCQKKSGNERVS